MTEGDSVTFELWSGLRHVMLSLSALRELAVSFYMLCILFLFTCLVCVCVLPQTFWIVLLLCKILVVVTAAPGIKAMHRCCYLSSIVPSPIRTTRARAFSKHRFYLQIFGQLLFQEFSASSKSASAASLSPAIYQLFCIAPCDLTSVSRP